MYHCGIGCSFEVCVYVYPYLSHLSYNENCVLTKIYRNVKEVVGELDFSFHIVSTASSSSNTLNSSERDKQD